MNRVNQINHYNKEKKIRIFRLHYEARDRSKRRRMLWTIENCWMSWSANRKDYSYVKLEIEPVFSQIAANFVNRDVNTRRLRRRIKMVLN